MAARECDVSHSLLAIFQKNMKQIIITAIALAVAGIIAGLAIVKYVEKHEQGECQRWQQQAIDYANAGFYLTDWQIEQCEAVGYPVKVAPVVPRKDFN